MKNFLLGILLFASACVSIEAQREKCSRDPPYPVYNLLDQGLRLVGSIPQLGSTTCNPGPAAKVVKFNCKTTGDDQYYTVDFSKPETFRHLRMDAQTKWTFVAHGFLGGCYRDWPIEMLKVLAASEPMNACCVDWSEWAKCNYVSDATKYVYAVGDYLADTVQLLHTKYNVALKQFILVGHSFGGIIIGIAGQRFKNPKLPIGIALDPAGILYVRVVQVDPKRRLSPGDFEVVKAIYTDEYGLGSNKPVGSVNIIANGGENQPNCDHNVFPCSHFTPTTFFTESMRPNQTGIYTIVSKDGSIQDKFTLYGKNIPGEYTLTTTKCYPYASPPVGGADNRDNRRQGALGRLLGALHLRT